MNKQFISLLLTICLFPLFQSLSIAQSSNHSYEPTQSKSSKSAVPNTTPISISVIQPYWPFDGDLIVNSPYTAIRIGEYYWMNQNLNDSIPLKYAEPWNSATPWVGVGSYHAITQDRLNSDMDRLLIDKSQFQINIKDFNKYYGRYYTRTDVEYFVRGENLKVNEGKDKVKTAWKVPVDNDFRQLFAMCPVPSNESLGQIAVRTTLSYKRNENPLAYDIYDPKGGTIYRTYWFEHSSNALGFNMMPGGSRVNGDGWINNGLGPNNGAWWCKAGDIYHLFHTAKYATQRAQITVHDWLNTGEPTSWHWYNVRLCRELTDKELGYKLYINIKDYQEDYQHTIKELLASKVDIKELGINDMPPEGYYELPKGYLRGFYVQYLLGKKPTKKAIKKIVEFLKQVDDGIFYDEIGNKVHFVPEEDGDDDDDDEEPIINNPKLEVYPIPVEDVLHVNLNDSKEQIKAIYIYNMYGLQISLTKDLDTHNSINTSDLPVGLLFLNVETNKQRYFRKMIK